MSDEKKIFRAYSIIEKGEGKEPYWHPIGTMFPHKTEGSGFNLLLEVMPIPVDGVCKIVIRAVEPKEVDAEEAPKKKPHGKR